MKHRFFRPHISHFRESAERTVRGSARASRAGFGALAETPFHQQGKQFAAARRCRPHAGARALPGNAAHPHRKVWDFRVSSLIRNGLTFLLAAFWLAGHLQAAPETVMGVPPEMLLSNLPQPPEGWKLVSSIGINEISALPALLTFAIREYRADPLPPQPGLPPSLPKLTKITLLDTAFDSDRASVFDVFKKPDSPKAKHTTFDGVQFVEQRVSDTKRTITAAFDSRFILSIILQNQDDKDREAWLKALEFPKLRAWAAQAPKLRPTPDFFKVSYVNELNPKSNQTLSMPYRKNEQ